MNIPKKIIDKIELAKKYIDKSNNLKYDIFTYFNKADINLEEIKGGSNSSNLEEMINCYIDYGEDSLEEILERLKGVNK